MHVEGLDDVLVRPLGGNQRVVRHDEFGIRELLSEILSEEGYQVRLAEIEEAVRTFLAEIDDTVGKLTALYQPDLEAA